MPTNPINRRRFLATSALAAGAASAATLLPDRVASTEAAADHGVTTITVMYSTGELSTKEVKIFEQQNPSIKVRQINWDTTRLSAMLAAGQPPDFIRINGATDMPSIAARGLAIPLDPYIKTSKVVRPQDIMPANDIFRWDGHTQGQGAYYGLGKDFGPETQIWYNKKLFRQAGVKDLDPATPISYDELLALGKKLTVRKGGKTVVYGLDLAWSFGWVYMQIVQSLAQTGKTLWNSDYTQARFTDPDVLKILRWYVDWAQARVGHSPLDPDPDGWAAPAFEADRLAIVVYGYWFQGALSSGPKGLENHIGFAPSPQWGPLRLSGELTGSGSWIPVASKNKDAAWKFMEYFFTNKPAYNRATSGWGVPCYRPYLKEMPRGTAPQRDYNRVLLNDLKYFQVLRFSPYITGNAMSSLINKYLTPVMMGQLPLQQAAAQLATATNAQLRANKEAIG